MGWPLSQLPRAAAAPVRYLSMDAVVGRSLVETVRQIFMSGASVTTPFVVTILILGVVFDFVANVIAPLARALTLFGLAGGQGGIVAQVATLAILAGVVFLAGLVAETGPTTGVERGLGRAVEAVPGVGSVYSSFDRMSEVMLDSDAESFRDVKLLEFPVAGVYSLAFQTSEVLDQTAGDGEGAEMLVLFVPLAPNPVMGGFMVCVPASQVRDVDMTVQEAFQAMVTSGVAMTESLEA